MNYETGTDDAPPDLSSGETGDCCANCGARLDPGDWHPTLGHTDADGTYRIVRFCSEACRDEWRAAHDDR